MRRLFISAILLLFIAPSYALDWDILNEDCSGIGDWDDLDAAGCTSSQVTFDGKSTFKFDAPSSAPDTNYAARERALSLPDTFTAEMRVYVDSISAYGGLYIRFYTSSDHQYSLRFGDTSFAINTGSYWHFCIAESYLDRWITARLVVKSGRKADLWIDNRIYIANLSCSETWDWTGMDIFNASDNADDALAYVDWIRIDTTPEAQTTSSPINIHNEAIAIRTVQTDVDYDESIDKLRIYGKPYANQPSVVCGIPLVATNDTNASKTRIYDGSTVKSLMKLPN